MAELPLVGEEFAGYRLVAIIGRGGMSTVFRAENPRLGNVIALKVLAPELASDDVFRTRFLEESRIAASMNHPNVIPIHDTGSSGGLLFIAMRYVGGGDVRTLFRRSCCSARRPGRSTRRTAAAWSTATSSRGTCWSSGPTRTPTPITCTWPTSASASKWPG